MSIDNLYVLKIDFRGRGGLASWYSNLEARINNNKLEIEHKISKSNDMLNTLKNCSGTYNIGEIKSVKFSSKPLYGIIYILLDLLIFCWIVHSIVNGISASGIEVGIGLWLIIKFVSRIKTIKVTFFNKKSVHIPIKLFWGRYSTINYKEEVIHFMNMIKDNINNIEK